MPLASPSRLERPVGNVGCFALQILKSWSRPGKCAVLWTISPSRLVAYWILMVCVLALPGRCAFSSSDCCGCSMGCSVAVRQGEQPRKISFISSMVVALQVCLWIFCGMGRRPRMSGYILLTLVEIDPG